MPGVLWAAVVGATVSGVPSTLSALATGADPLAASRAAGTLLGKPTLPRAAAAHALLSMGWAVVLHRALPRRRPVVEGAVAGLAIAALDLAVVARRLFPAVRALPQAPQWADHVAYGVAVSLVLARQRT